MADELLDIVDEKDNIVGQELRSVMYTQDKKHMLRAVWLFLKNKDGKLWIPRRAATKSSHPLSLDGSVVGCVAAGETYEQAVEREAQEEVGIDIKGNYNFMAYVNPAEGISVSHIKIYVMSYEDTPIYTPDEFCEDFWLTPQEIMKKCKEEKTSKTTLPNLIEKFFL